MAQFKILNPEDMILKLPTKKKYFPRDFTVFGKSSLPFTMMHESICFFKQFCFYIYRGSKNVNIGMDNKYSLLKYPDLER